MSRLVALACLVVACAEPSSHTGVVPLSQGGERAPLAGPGPSAAPAPAPGEPWVDSVRSGDVREAQRRLDLLPPERARSPEVRYVRARAAAAVRDFAGARRLLEGLERELPLLASEISRDRAECALEVGPFDEAARFFAARGDAASAVKAARALGQMHAAAEARAALDRALRVLGSDDDPRAFATRVEARALRAKIARDLHDSATAATDLRWLAIEAAGTDAGRAALAGLAALSPPAHLTPEQELIRSKKLAESGRLDEALVAVDAALHGSPKPTASALVRARGFAYYASRADYAKAAVLLEEASKLDPKEAPRDLFFAARARARSQDDAAAILAYDALAQRFPNTSFAEEAAYQAARLRFLLGQWDAAAKAYRGYIDAHTKRRAGRFVEAARYELALTLLASKHGGDAAPILRSLAEKEEDALDRASLHELEGAALAEAGDRERASALFRAVVRERPLSFPALAGAAHLAELGGEAVLAVERGGPEGGPFVPLAVGLPEKAALFSRLGLVPDAEREIARHESELLARYAPRGYEALCEAFSQVGSGAERYRVGRAAVKGEALERAPTDATRWAWDCVYPTPFLGLVRAAELERGLPRGLIHAVMRQESAFRTDALSPASAIGLLQLIPGTALRVAHELGVDEAPELLRAPGYNVQLGAYYLHKVLGTFGGQVVLAAAAYNAGPRAVSRWLETGEALPLDVWVARIPFTETRGYVSRVVGNLARYAYLEGGERAVPRISLALPLGIRAAPGDY
jgi:soluble lytic murein transglycosylase